MFGLLIAVMLAIVLFAKGRTGDVIFKKTSSFLFKWYLIVASIVLFVSVVAAVIGTTSLGFLVAGPLGALAGSVAGGAVSLFIILWVAVAYVLQIAGSKIMYDSVTQNNDGSAAFDTTRLALGLAMLFVGVFGLPFLS